MNPRRSGSSPPTATAWSVEVGVAEAIAAEELGDIEEACQLAAEVLRHDPFNREAQRIVRDVDPPPCELRRLAVLFCDLVGSTSMSATRDPVAYGRTLERYHRRCADIIESHGGTVTRRLGDGVLALFGHPVPFGDDTRRAVRAGLALVERFSDSRVPDGANGTAAEEEQLHVRVAVHHGALHLDLVDSEIYGFVPNLAARLQEAAGTDSLVVSDSVIDLVGRFFESTAHEPVILKGIESPVSFHVVTAELPPSAQADRWATTFVGRSDELSEALERLDIGPNSPERDGSGSGGSTALLVHGSIGIGRTRFMAEVLRAARSHGQAVRWLVCSAVDSTTPFGVVAHLLHVDPIVSIAPSASGRLFDLEADLDRLGLDRSETLALLAPLLGIEPGEGYEPAGVDITKLHDRMLDAVRRWISALARHLGDPGSPGLLIGVDDLHLADPSSLQLLSSLANLPVAGVKLLATARTGEKVIEGRGVASLELGPLSAVEAQAMLLELGPTIDDATAASILGRCDGNPWFLEEMVEQAAGVDADGDAPTPFDPPSGTTTVPTTLYEPLLKRIYSPDVDVGMVQAAAVIGTSFTTSTLGHLVRRSPDRLARGLNALVKEGIIRPVGNDTYRFAHELLRDVAYEMQPEDERRDAHRLVADVLSQVLSAGGTASWARVAQHLHSAGDAGRAVQAYERAADVARSRGALDQGRDHLSDAIDLVGTSNGEAGGPLNEASLRLKRAFLNVATGGNADPRARADYEECSRLAQSDETSPQYVETLVALWGYHAARGDMERAASLLDEIDASGLTDDPLSRAENDAGRGLVDFLSGRFEAADARFRSAAAGFDAVGDVTAPTSRWQFPNDPAVWMHTWRGVTRWQLGDVDGFRRHVSAARRRAEVLPFPHGPFSLCQALYVESWIRAELGDVAESIALADEVATVSARHGFDFWSLAADTARATALSRDQLNRTAPDHETILEHIGAFTRAEVVATLGDTRVFLPSTLTLRSTQHLELGDPETCFSLLDSAEKVAHETGCEFYLAEIERHRGRARWACGYGDAAGVLARALMTSQRQGAVVFELRALTDLERAGALGPAEAGRLADLRADPGCVTAAGPILPASVGA